MGRGGCAAGGGAGRPGSSGAGSPGYPRGFGLATICDALEIGVKGVVRGQAATRELADALRFEAPLADEMKRRAAEGPSLTAREVEVLTRIGNGESVEEIAHHLVLSEHTVRTHIRNAMGKFGARTRADAVARALVLRKIR
jgi:DNA-binding NarL/FixJ family response regulator